MEFPFKDSVCRFQRVVQLDSGKWEAYGPICYSGMEHMEPMQQTQVESILLPHQRAAKDGRGELE